MKYLWGKVYLVKEYVYYFIIQHKMTKKEFCKKCDISRKQLRMFEKNDGELGLEEIYKIFRYINIPIRYAFLDLDSERVNKQDIMKEI